MKIADRTLEGPDDRGAANGVASSDIVGLRERALPAGLVIEGLIARSDGERLFGYEGWLRELVNESQAFMSKTGGRRFAAPPVS